MDLTGLVLEEKRKAREYAEGVMIRTRNFMNHAARQYDRGNFTVQEYDRACKEYDKACCNLRDAENAEKGVRLI